MEASVKRYNNQVHSTIRHTPDTVRKIDNAVQEAKIILKEKHNRRYPRIEEGDYVRAFVEGKGNYTSGKETRSQWSERKYRVNLKSHDMMNNTFCKLEGLTKRYNRTGTNYSQSKIEISMFRFLSIFRAHTI